MPTPMPPTNNYDPRWFIWTIVFLVVTGISLVSYIVLSDPGTSVSTITVPHVLHKQLSQQKK
jgi:hypothetical protein